MQRLTKLDIMAYRERKQDGRGKKLTFAPRPNFIFTLFGPDRSGPPARGGA